LESSAGFLQAKVAKRIDTRYTPRLSFVVDQGVKKSLEVLRILQEVLPKDSAAAAGPEAAATDGSQYHDGDTIMDDEENLDQEEDSSNT
jgi:ribosome-binding factor A